MDSIQRKQEIQAKIQAFVQGSFYDNCLALFDELGYLSDKRITLHKEDIEEQFEDHPNAKKARALFDDWQDVYFLFQLTDDEIQRIQSDTYRAQDYQSYVFLAIELSQKQYSRTNLSKINREVNKLFAMPVMILFKYHDHLSFAITNRRPHKRESEKTVLEKVTLIKDISIASPHRAHIEILFNLSFEEVKRRERFMTFLELHNAWQKILDTSELNRQFYQEVAELFTRLVGGKRKIGSRKIDEPGVLQLPGTSDDTIRKNFAVRLIGRLLFCWFLKKKTSAQGVPLIPETVLSSAAVFPAKSRSAWERAGVGQFPSWEGTGVGKNIPMVQEASELTPKFHQEGNRIGGYYHAVLEPLFFEVLNKRVEDRANYLKTGDWGIIPFLNGGLFEAHHQDFYKPDALGISKHLNTLAVPEEWIADLFKVFEHYHFTIEESTPIDVEISIDPEMLGRIFENLLAEINPETGETARKATGSYYTPRPIVEYMVDESLKQYLLTATDVSEEQLTELLSYQETDLMLSSDAKKTILDALDQVKILDPACGSGAFPMGILQKILLILQKVDPDAEQWLERLLLNIPDPFAREMMQKKLKGESEMWNYTRKLGVIQKSIYGVDIQPIAAEISKLRFFLSLVVDEKVDDDHPDGNRGIIELPNLEFKFVCADTLIGLPKGNLQLFESGENIQQLKSLRTAYFTSYGRQKDQIREEFRTVQQHMAQELLKSQQTWGKKESETLRLSKWDPFTDDKCEWFDPAWMFGVENGFDIVIANPPYVLLQNKARNEALYRLFKNNYEVASYKIDFYHLFIEKGIKNLKQNGLICYITPSNFISNNYSIKLREFILEKTSLKKIIFFDDNVFEASVNNLVFLSINTKPNKQAKLSFFHVSIQDSSLLINLNSTLNQSIFHKNNYLLVPPKNEDILFLINKLEKNAVLLKDIATVNFGMQLRDRKKFPMDVINSISKDTKLTGWHKPCYTGKDIAKYTVNYNGRYCYFNRIAKKGGCWDEEVHFTRGKLLARQIGESPIVGIDLEGFAVLNTAFMIVVRDESIHPKYLLAILNSKLIEFYWKNRYFDDRKIFPKIKGGYLKLLPIIKVDIEEQKPFIKLVDYVLYLKTYLDESIDEYVPNKYIAKDFENVIDGCVYELYFEAEMKTQNVDILRFVREQFKPLTPTMEQQEIHAILRQSYAILRESRGEIRNRLLTQPIVVESVKMILERS